MIWSIDMSKVSVFDKVTSLRRELYKLRYLSRSSSNIDYNKIKFIKREIARTLSSIGGSS